MKIGFIGLGKMGGNMVQRLLLDKHEIVVLDRSTEAMAKMAEKGAKTATSIAELIAQLPERKLVWLMVPAGAPVDENIAELLQYLKPGDVIVDGGNSFWRESIERGKRTAEKGVEYIDCGTSGGVWGLQNGYCLMYGGTQDACSFAEPLFKSLAPADGYLHCGASGSGHLVKMVHNGIEYGMMQAFAEGFEVLEKSPYGFDLQKISHLWMQGSVVRSWLLELIGNALTEDASLDKLEPFVQDSGEARWTLQTAMDFDVPAHVIASSLFVRFQSRQNDSFALKLLAAMRNQFGGHAVKAKE